MPSTFVDRKIAARLRHQTEEAAQAALVKLAHDQHARVIRESDPSASQQFVDGRAGLPFEAVQPFGRIFVEYNYFAEIAQRALAHIRKASPVDEGDYVEDHGIYVDGIQTPLASIGMARRMVIANTMPYARVIERGIGKRVPWSKQPQVPKEGVYSHVVQLLRREYSRIVLIRFGWVGLDENTEVADAKRQSRYPAIIVESRI